MQTSSTITAVRRKGTPPESGVQELLRSLKEIGIEKKTVAEVLPIWWDNSIAEDPAGLIELKVMLARRFSLDPATMFDDEKNVDFLPIVRKYKGGSDSKDLGVATGIASSLCRTALSFMGVQDVSSFADPAALRASILATGAHFVGMRELLSVCWRANVPVLHVSLPPGLLKFDALVTSSADKYAISLCRNEDSDAWLAFHIAHEIGHIALGHLVGDAMLVDEKIETNPFVAQQEREANEYAAVLMGSSNVKLPALSYSDAASFLNAGRKEKVLPGHLVLKAGSEGDFKCARAVLKRVEGKTQARKLINDWCAEELSSRWNYDAEEFISQFFHKSGV